MSHWEILNWCKSKEFNNPNDIAALLFTFTPDLEELDSWDIEEESYNIYHINDIKYEILSEDEVKEEIEQCKSLVESDYLDEVPETLQEYINWKQFWMDNPITPKEYLSNYSTVLFRGILYYYNEI